MVGIDVARLLMFRKGLMLAASVDDEQVRLLLSV